MFSSNYFKILIYTLLSLLSFSCSNMQDFDNQEAIDPGLTPEGKLQIPLFLQVPSFSLIETRAEEKTEEEAKIHSLGILVFDASDPDNLLEADRLIQSAFIDIDKLYGPDYSGNIYAELTPCSEDCYVLVYANLSEQKQREIDELIRSAADMISWKELCQFMISIEELYLEPAKPGGNYNNRRMVYPMSSEPLYLSEISSQTTKKIEVPLSMVCARIDITAATLSHFTLKSAQILNGEQQCFLWSASVGHSSEYPLLTYQPVPASPDGSDLISPIYVFPTHSEEKAIDLIINGDYTDKIGNTFLNGFYKIRIHYPVQSGNSSVIRRNTLYRVLLKSIDGPGYSTLEEAIRQQHANLQFDIEISDNSSKDIVITNGSYYLGVSHSEHIVFTDQQCDLKAFTIRTNAPDNLIRTAVDIEGEGVNFLPGQRGLIISDDLKSARIPLPIIEQDIYVSIKGTATTAKINLRIGDLFKQVTLIRKPGIDETREVLIPTAEFGKIDQLLSLSDRIDVTDPDHIRIRPASQMTDRNRVFASCNAFSLDRNHNIKFSVPRKIREVVYYEKYPDGNTGLYLQNNSVNSLRDDIQPLEAGYGVLLASASDGVVLRVDGAAVSPVRLPVSNVFEDLPQVYLYAVNEADLREKVDFSTAKLTLNGEELSQTIYPNFAKAIYSSGKLADETSGRPFSIRTPRQFCRINNLASSPNKTYVQERDLDFKNIALGGMPTFPDTPIRQIFAGIYDGQAHAIVNFEINQPNKTDLALFKQNQGELKNIRVTSAKIYGRYHLSALAASNKGCINAIDVSKSQINTDQTSSYLGSDGFIAGQNSGTVSNSFVKDSKLSGSQSSGGVVGENTGNVRSCCVFNTLVHSKAQYTGGIAGHNNTGGSIHNCMLIADSRSNYPVYGESAYVGGITGCNHKGSKGIYDVMVLDLNTVCNRTLVNSVSSAYVGGIVGRNESALQRALFIARAPHWYESYPIAGLADTPSSDCFFLTNFNVMTKYSGGGTGLDQSEFISDIVLSKLSDYFTTDPKCPYPYLRFLGVPESWPWKE